MAIELKHELDEIQSILLSFQKDSKAFLAEDPFKQPKKSWNDCSKKEKSLKPSSWALSSFSRGNNSKVCAKPESNDENSAVVQEDVLLAEQRAKTTAPSYSFPKAKLHDSMKSATESAPCLHPNFAVDSRRKRSHVCKLYPEPASLAKPFNAPVNLNDNRDATTSEVRQSSVLNRAYSFGKQERLPGSRGAGEGDGQSHLALDVNTALEAVKPRSAYVHMHPPAAKPSISAIVPEHGHEEGTEHLPLGVPSLDAESHRERIRSVRMTDPSKVSRSRIPLTRPPPGPGYYQIDTTFAEEVSGGGRFANSSTKLKPEARTILHQRVSSLGPGCYDTSAAENYVRTKSSTAIDMSKATSAADSKTSEHVLRKQYWEAKARDLREDNDDMLEINFDAVRPKTPTLSIRPASIPKMKQSGNIDAKSKDILKEIDDLLELSPARDVLPSFSDVNYHATEKRVVGLVNMEAESAARKSHRELLRNRPGVADVLAKKQKMEFERGPYLGPQLQIPWAQDRKKSNDATVDDAEDARSPTKEVLKLLSLQGWSKEASELESNVKEGDSETALAYMKSFQANGKGNIIDFDRLKKEEHRSKRDERDYLGPQIISDWKRDTSSRLHAYSMDKNTGRDVLRVEKGDVKVCRFNAEIISTELLGPGIYDNSARSFGAGAKGVVPFSKLSENHPSDFDNDKDGDVLDLNSDKAHRYVMEQLPQSISLYKQVP